MLLIPQEDFLQQTGLHHIYTSEAQAAIAAKVGGDNMALLELNTQMIQALKALGVAQSYAVSAFRSSKQNFNTTGKLINAGEHIKNGNSGAAQESFEEVSLFHEALIDEIILLSPPEIKRELQQYSHELFAYYGTLLRDARSETSSEIDYIISGESGSFSLLSVGEIVAAKLMVRFLELHGIDARYIDTEAMEFSGRESINNQVISFLQQELFQAYRDNPSCIPIIPGYVGGISGGILQTLGRGYTDYTGAQAAVALHDGESFDSVALYIQKLYGFKSTDPRKLAEESRAKPVNILSYGLTERAISHRGAAAGLINPYALSQEIKDRAIPILVGNPTDDSDIAIINAEGCRKSTGVNLVLGRDFNGDYDSRVYGMANVGGHEADPKRVVYLMGENMRDLGTIYMQAQEILNAHNITAIAGSSQLPPHGELSFVFTDEQTATTSQRLLHEYFIEKKSS